ncbi:hypothetical protein V6N12_066347 [Hibiscus sabdariffa]|uniref:DUF3741 domain-containing protein n=1 Tax=Hibiscus sabdariffa TaxID=183260 RepID=A0ABR2CPU1_9ROSI
MYNLNLSFATLSSEANRRRGRQNPANLRSYFTDVSFWSQGVEMNGLESRRGQNIEKFPGCLGRMVNLFDLNMSVPGNRLLTDNRHDGSSLSRSQSDIARMLRPTFGDQNHQIEDKVILSELRRAFSNKKGNGTSMKMLIAQEMSKEVASKHNSPNLVAKLMGLDALPRQHHSLSAQRCHSKCSSQQSSSHSDIPVEGFADKEVLCEINPCQELNKYKDVNEIWHHSPRAAYSRDSSPQKGSYKDDMNERKMALVRQKFIEAKHLVTDEKLRQTKEFQEALEVLSSNRELFLKFLEEPNSKFSQHLFDFQSLSQPPEKMRITVLRPKMIENEKFVGIGSGDKQTKKPARMGHGTGWDRKNGSCYPPFPSREVDEYPSQPTRIVVLKPSPGKSQDIKTMASPSPSSPRILHGDDFYEDLEDDGTQEPREVAKEITRQLRENLFGHRRDETLLSSVFSNGYIDGVDSSLNRSENEYAVENLSDSEVTSPTSRHSWDYINRFSVPYSSSSFSQASCSPESLVCREAKKRLSERWAMMASNGNSQEQRHVRRSSSTLGEMLALSDTKKLVRSKEEGSTKEQEPRGSTSCIAGNLNEEKISDSPKNLLRSKSAPVSSTAYGARLNIELSDPESSKEQVSKELTKAKSMKSSLKGKVSSLFFSKNKKTNKEKCIGSQTADELPSTTPGTPGSPMSHPQKIDNDAYQCINGSCNQVCLSPVLGGSVRKTPSPYLTGMGLKQGRTGAEGGLSLVKPPMLVHISENQDQPSPISVLEPLFDEDENTNPEFPCSIKPVHQGVEVPVKSNLIDKSPPIESIARTLSWHESRSETATINSSKPSKVSSGAKEEEQDWVFSVRSLLSAAGLNGKVCFESFIARWHSPESPLDPSLREKYANSNDKEHQRRSNMKLIFDCVNAAILELTGYGSSSYMRTMSLGWSHMRDIESASSSLADHVCVQMKEWNSSDSKRLVDDDDDDDDDGDGDVDSHSLVVERVVQKEVAGKGWVDQMNLEADSLGSEIEGKLLHELVEEAVVDMTGMVF